MGILVCLSGLDGSGKTTQAEMLKNYFCEKECLAEIIHLKLVEIPMQSIKERCKEYIKECNISDMITIRNIFSAINFQKKVENTIIPLLNANNVVIVNRYIDSAMCYHYLKGGLSAHIDNIYANLPAPDYNIFIDVLPEICFSRILSRKEHNEFETLPYLVKAYKFYQNRKEKFSWIDGQQEKGSVLKSILATIEK